MIYQVFKSSFHVGDDILNLLFLYDFFRFFHANHMLRFDKVTYLSLLFKFIFYARLSNNLRGSDVSLFLEFINIVFNFVLYLY